MKIPSLLLAVATFGDAKPKIHLTILRLSFIKFYFVWSLSDWQLLPQNLKPSRLDKSHFA